MMCESSFGSRGCVASGHPSVTEAACTILRAGGNAFDAVVAAGFAASVAEPALTSLGGGGFLLARTIQGKSILFDFFVDTPGKGLNRKSEPNCLPVTVQFPSSEQVFNIGMGAVAVPGTLKGYIHVQRRLGRLPLSEVLAPAIKLARDGLIINSKQAYFLDLLLPIMTSTVSGCALFKPAGNYLREGDIFRNQELSTFMESLTHGGEREFYEGELAKSMAYSMFEGSGSLTLTDLSSYRVIEREPLSFNYRGHRLLTNTYPSLGGPLIMLSLRLLERCRVTDLCFGSAAHISFLVSVMREIDFYRANGYTEDLDCYGLSQNLELGCNSSFLGSTTHISVYDAAGNAASMTTSNGEGSGCFAANTGIMLNNMMGEDDLHQDGFHIKPPGMRVTSMMAPSLLLADDKLQLILGSGGSKRIRSAIIQVIFNIVDLGFDLCTAVKAPRIHWDGHQIQAEPGFDDAILASLATRWPVNCWKVQDMYFGGVHAVSTSGEGVGDPRRDGHSTVVY
jgi:gamma-glutamyltranspeptidase/glutathione hydrolase